MWNNQPIPIIIQTVFSATKRQHKWRFHAVSLFHGKINNERSKSNENSFIKKKWLKMFIWFHNGRKYLFRFREDWLVQWTAMIVNARFLELYTRLGEPLKKSYTLIVVFNFRFKPYHFKQLLLNPFRSHINRFKRIPSAFIVVCN